MNSTAASTPNPISSKMLEINIFLYQFKPMKKNLFIAALLCSISFAGKAATNETKTTSVEKSTVAAAKIAIPARVKFLYETTFTCAAGGWSVQVYGRTVSALNAAVAWYETHASC